jgi:hypothetical protein
MMLSPQGLNGGNAFLQRPAEPVFQIGPLGGRVAKTVLVDNLLNHSHYYRRFWCESKRFGRSIPAREPPWVAKPER